MKRIILSLFLFLLWMAAKATTLCVALDGSQAYSSIQLAINASTHGDTVLVYPGRYLENLRFNGKNISLASLELITGNRDYVYSTIIDAHHSGAGIMVYDYESNVTIRGFTIANGTGMYHEDSDTYLGGGIVLGRRSGEKRASIINCHVSGNRATIGGGFWGGGSFLILSGVTFTDNYASIGGAMHFQGGVATPYTVNFDQVNRCNIYSNYAAVGSDLYFYNMNAVHVVVDTFTVANPWNFYASAVPASPNISNPYSFDILHTVHEEVNNDLYVATWGDDSNSGLSPAEPLRNIFMAMYKIASDSLNPKTVYVEDGYYSKSRNGQIFPVPVKSYVSLVGESREGVILDAESRDIGIFVAAGTECWQVSNLSMSNAKRGVSSSNSGSHTIRDVIINSIQDAQHAFGIHCYENHGTSIIEDVTITNVRSDNWGLGFSMLQKSGRLEILSSEISNMISYDQNPGIDISTRADCDILINGLSIHNNSSNSSDEFAFNSIVQISPFDNDGTRLRIELRNSAFYDNYQARPGQMGNIRSLNDTLFIENCTFAGNSGGGPVLYVQGTSVLRNNIFHNPAMNTQLGIPNNNSSGIYSHTTLSYNNILGGSSGVYNASPQNPLIWGEGNTNENPLFSNTGNRPYSLSALSPLIDSGWQPASGLALDALDAGGNERIWDGDGDGNPIIDKGAYEYQYLYAPTNLSAQLWQNTLELSWEMPGINRALSGYRIFRNNTYHADVWGAENLYFREQLTVSDTLQYRVAALYGNMESEQSDSVQVIYTAVSTNEEVITPQMGFSVNPNPFGAITNLTVNLSAYEREVTNPVSAAHISIYNIKGQLVKTLELDPHRSGEQYSQWDGRDTGNLRCSSGIYLMNLVVDGVRVSSKKVTLLR